MEYIYQHVAISSNDLIIEPSAGNGSFVEYIKQMSSNCVFIDIEPEHPEIKKQDYLTTPNHREGWSSTYYPLRGPHKIHVIGNPPFGRQSSLAIKFIKKSCEFCDSLCFILPKSFKKDSMKKFFPLKYHLVFETDLPNNAFTVQGKYHNVPCVFQIWIKKECDRDVNEKLFPVGYKFVTELDSADISFRRIGTKAGTIETNIADKSPVSHYFIKFTNGLPLEENLNALSGITFECNNTVGPKSISKQELIQKFNDKIRSQTE